MIYFQWLFLWPVNTHVLIHWRSHLSRSATLSDLTSLIVSTFVFPFLSADYDRWIWKCLSSLTLLRISRPWILTTLLFIMHLSLVLRSLLILRSLTFGSMYVSTADLRIWNHAKYTELTVQECKTWELSGMVHACNSSMWDVEAGRSQQVLSRDYMTS